MGKETMKMIKIQDKDHSYFKGLAGTQGCLISDIVHEAKALHATKKK